MLRVLNNVLFNQTRNIGKRPPKHWKSDGVQYGLVTYYPRHKDHVDPPITPTKLLAVRRVKPIKGQPYWDRRVLEHLKIEEKRAGIAIVKNTPEMCKTLWQIKHLIEITPINLPENLPDDECLTWLHDNGDLLVGPPVDPSREQATIDFKKNPKKLERRTISDELRHRWYVPYDF